MSMPRAVRHINEVRILDTLLRKGAMTRADLGRELGLMRSTAGNLVANLARDGLVLCDPEERSEPRLARTGRPGNLIELNGRHSLFLGAEIGVGRITVVAIDLNAEIATRRVKRFDPDHPDPAVVAEGVAEVVGRVLTRVEGGAVRGLNVTVQGLIDRSGCVMRAPILGWSGVPLMEMLRAHLPDLPMAAENDANAFAMAETYRDDWRSPRDGLYLFMDAGIGGGLVSQGQLVRGYHGYAGEVGHMPVGERGYLASSALPGSLESFIGREAVLERDRFHGGASQTMEQFEAALTRGTDGALATATEWVGHLGRGLATLTCVLNPDSIVLGGPMAVLARNREGEVVEAMRRYLLPDHPIPSVRVSTLGSEGPAVGAALMIHKQTFSFDDDLVFNRGSSREAMRDGAWQPFRAEA